MSDRFLPTEDGIAIKALLARLSDCSPVDFLSTLKTLQPNKKWTPLKERYWFVTPDKPIYGILAKLIGAIVRDTQDKRLKIVMGMAGITDIPNTKEKCADWRARNVKPILNHEDKAKLMKICLFNKFNYEPYKTLLLSTGDAPLHELPLRGNGERNDWTYKIGKDGTRYGGDLLGRLLMDVRSELQRVVTTQTGGGCDCTL